MNRHELSHRGETGLSFKNPEKLSQSDKIAAQIADFEAKGGKVERVDGFIERSMEWESRQTQKYAFGVIDVDVRRDRTNKASRQSTRMRGLGNLKFGIKERY